MKILFIYLCLILGCMACSEENKDFVFFGTIEELETSPIPESKLNWIVKCRIDKIESGNFEGKSFSFRIHSPSQSGLEVGKQYKIIAKWAGDGYTVDEYQWAERALNK